MSKDKLFQSGNVPEDFTFNDKVAEVFDDMLNRSVPFYSTVIDAMAILLQLNGLPENTVYDLGCSTGTTLLELAKRLPGPDCRFIGIDNAPAMIEKARRKAEMYARSASVQFMTNDITAVQLDDAGAILCNYTLQFIRPMTRLQFVKNMYNALPDGGIFIVSEKVICHDPKLNRHFIEMHHRFKRLQGYSELEIATKREAIENVLVPFSIEENIDLLHQGGFQSVETFFQWFNFASFVAIKQS